MGYMIEITENKVNEMSELVEKMLKYGGKLMHCIDEMGDDKYGRMGHRNPMPDYRDNWDDDDDRSISCGRTASRWNQSKITTCPSALKKGASAVSPARAAYCTGKKT